MERGFFLVALFLYQMIVVNGFMGHSTSFLRSTIWCTHRQEQIYRNDRFLTVVNDQRWNREIEESSRKKAQGGGMGETVAGAVLGSLILGPFGRCFVSYPLHNNIPH